MPDAAPRLRVCIVAKSTPFIWVHHYIKAFRALCDVVTVGPSISAGDLDTTGRTHLAHLVKPNDVDREVHTVEELIESFPSTWRPDLVLSIQSGAPRVENIDWLSCPTAHISVDTWHDFAEMVHARPFDFVFAAQREFAAHFASAGCAHAHWLPLACDPDVHRPVDCGKDFDIAFVGSAERAVHAQRIARIGRLAQRFSVCADTALDADTMSRAYARGRLAFNSSVAQDVNMRVFETMAMGVPLLTNRDADVNGLLDLFNDDEHLIAYDDADLVDVAARFLNDRAARERIGHRARERVLAHHTYIHRAQELLHIVSAHVDWETVRARPLLRGRGSLLDYVPGVPGHAADFGMNAGVSKHALRRLGVARFTGIALDPRGATQRVQSFDDVQLHDDAPRRGEPFDTVLAIATNAVGTANALLERLRELLRPGGALVAGLTRSTIHNLSRSGNIADAWAAIEAFGFVVLRMELIEATGDDDVFAFVVARRRDRTLKDIARDVYSRNPIPGLSLEETVARVP